MLKFMRSLVCFVCVCLLNAQAQAEADNWDYEATVYLFAAETETSIGPVSATLSFSDALENLDMTFMGAFSASNGKWSFLLDYMHTDLSFSDIGSGPASLNVNASVQTNILNAYTAYRVFDDNKMKLDLAGGLRWYDTRTTLTVRPGVAPTTGDDWIDPVVAVRARVRLSDRWTGTGFLDYGGFSSSSESWQVLLTAEYAINDTWLLRGGYRYISVEHTVSGLDYDFSQSGPIFGVTYKF